MQYFVYFTSSEDKPASPPPTPEAMAEMGRFMQESIDSGIVVSTGQLGQETTYVTLQDGMFSVTDGPFMEGKELIPGFTIISVDTRQEAVDWTKRLRACWGDGELRMSRINIPGGP